MSSLSRRIDSILGSTYFLSPVWALRTGSILAITALLLGELLFVKGFAHGICLGLGLGQLWIIVVSSLLTSRIDLRTGERDDPQQLGLTN